LFKGLQQFGALRAKFLAMVERQLAKHLLSARGQVQQDLAAVLGAAAPADVSRMFQAVHQFYGAMMLDLQALGQFPYSRAHTRPQAFECQQELVLARLQTGVARRPLAEVKKAADVMAKVG
jgi:hypothetical protein